MPTAIGVPTCGGAQVRARKIIASMRGCLCTRNPPPAPGPFALPLKRSRPHRILQAANRVFNPSIPANYDPQGRDQMPAPKPNVISARGKSHPGCERVFERTSVSLKLALSPDKAASSLLDLRSNPSLSPAEHFHHGLL